MVAFLTAHNFLCIVFFLAGMFRALAHVPMFSCRGFKLPGLHDLALRATE